MSPTTRRIIFYLFLSLFLASAPIILLTTTGYRWSPKRGRLELQGALLVKSMPRNATIELNGERREETTPALIHLSPNEYEIQIKKSGYYPWKKILTIASQETTFAETVMLFRESVPQKLSPTVGAGATISPDYRFIASIRNTEQKSELWIFDRRAERDINLGPIDPASSLRFSPSGSLLLASSGSLIAERHVVIDMTALAPINAPFLNTRSYGKMRWGETDTTLYAASGGLIFAINLFTGRDSAVAAGDAPFLFRGTEVWTMARGEDDNQFLAKSHVGYPELKPEPLTRLPAGRYEFLPMREPYLLMRERSSEHTFLIDARRPREIILDLPGNDAAARRDGQGNLEILTWNQFELWRGVVETGATELLLRQTSPLTSAGWLPEREYVYVTSNGQIELLELDRRDEPNRIMVADFRFDQVQVLAAPASEFLIFTALGGPDAGIYLLGL